MDLQVASILLQRAAAIQRRHDGGPIEPLKRAAKRYCTDTLNARLAPGSRILDVGGEEFYHGELVAHHITVANLPLQDMHELSYRESFEAVMAMHVLEHSPFSLYVLGLLHRALIPGGWLYVAVPHPSERICAGFGHWTILPPQLWRQHIDTAGFSIVSETTGKMGARKDWIEERFLCQRPV